MGDQVYDPEADREGIVTDVQRGSVFILRLLHGPGI